MPERKRIFSFDPPGGFAELELGEVARGKTLRWDEVVPEGVTDLWYVVESSPYEDEIQQAVAREKLGALIKLWHDDVRKPPSDAWIWVRSNDAAKAVLASVKRVDVLSMDHDLGGSKIPLGKLFEETMNGNDPDFWAIEGAETGAELADWIGRTDRYPKKITVHSMNPIGAANITNALMRWSEQSQRTCEITVAPFSR